MSLASSVTYRLFQAKPSSKSTLPVIIKVKLGYTEAALRYQETPKSQWLNTIKDSFLTRIEI